MDHSEGVDLHTDLVERLENNTRGVLVNEVHGLSLIHIFLLGRVAARVGGSAISNVTALPSAKDSTTMYFGGLANRKYKGADDTLSLIHIFAEIKLVVKKYGEAAKRCQKAGIDIIEIHAGIGYMVMRFISKYSNHRTDEYGGSTENRCRLLTDIIDEIHRVCGEDYPILIRCV